MVDSKLSSFIVVGSVRTNRPNATLILQSTLRPSQCRFKQLTVLTRLPLGLLPVDFQRIIPRFFDGDLAGTRPYEEFAFHSVVHPGFHHQLVAVFPYRDSDVTGIANRLFAGGAPVVSFIGNPEINFLVVLYVL